MQIYKCLLKLQNISVKSCGFPGFPAVVPPLEKGFRPLPVLVLIEGLVPDELHVFAEADADLSVDIEDADNPYGQFFVSGSDKQRIPFHHRQRPHP